MGRQRRGDSLSPLHTDETLEDGSPAEGPRMVSEASEEGLGVAAGGEAAMGSVGATPRSKMAPTTPRYTVGASCGL